MRAIAEEIFGATSGIAGSTRGTWSVFVHIVRVLVVQSVHIAPWLKGTHQCRAEVIGTTAQLHIQRESILAVVACLFLLSPQLPDQIDKAVVKVENGIIS
jgi:hypothetical protein